MTTLFATVLVFGSLIAIHELGHLLAAKSVGIRVTRFAVGFGRPLLRWKGPETEYALCWIPLGGYVLFDPEPGPRHFDSQSVLARMWVVSAGVLMNFVFAALIFAGLAHSWGEVQSPEAKLAGLDAASLPPVSTDFQRIPLGQTITALGERPVSHWNDLEDAIGALSGRQVVSLASGDTVHVTIPSDRGEKGALALALWPAIPPMIAGVQAGSPAEHAGLKVGDLVLSMNEKPVTSWPEFTRAIEVNGGQTVAIEVLRDEKRLVLKATPAVLDGGNEDRPRLGVQTELPRHPLPFHQALIRGAQMTWAVTGMTVQGFARIFGTDLETAREVGGPIMITQLSGEAAEKGAADLFTLIALLSVNLAVLNLMPIPILDGGHLVFLLIEAITRRPVPEKARKIALHIGAALLLGLVIWAFLNDILRLFGI